MKVLVCYDGSADADGALRDLELAGLPPRVEVLVLTQTTPWVTFATDLGLPLSADIPFPETPEESLQEARQVAEKGASRLLSRFPRWKVKSQGGLQEPAIGILEVADRWKPDLVVLGSHGRSALGRLFLGSVSQKVLHHAKTDVRITRPGIRTRLGPPRLLIGVDGSLGSMAAVAAVTSRSWPRKTLVRVLGVLSDRPAFRPGLLQPGRHRQKLKSLRLDQLERRLSLAAGRLAAAGLKAEYEVLPGDPRDILLVDAKSWKADAIFLGCRGLGALERFLIGSISSVIAEQASCTVEVIRRSRRSRGGRD